MIVDATHGDSIISETAAFLGFLRSTVSRVYREWCDKQNTFSEREFCGQNTLFMREVRRECPDSFKPTERPQILK
jgi:hypothetical protein